MNLYFSTYQTIIKHYCVSSCPRVEFWRRHSYTSLNYPLDSEGSSEESEGEGEEGSDREIQYLVGDVTRPQHTGTSDAIVVHCVGECLYEGWGWVVAMEYRLAVQSTWILAFTLRIPCNSAYTLQ